MYLAAIQKIKHMTDHISSISYRTSDRFANRPVPSRRFISATMARIKALNMEVKCCRACLSLSPFQSEPPLFFMHFIFRHREYPTPHLAFASTTTIFVDVSIYHMIGPRSGTARHRPPR